MEAHGGYLVRVEAVDEALLTALAREAWASEGHHVDECSLQVTRVPGRPVFRVAYDHPRTYGRRGARWYQTHHALAEIASRKLRLTVHVYVFDPEELEAVIAYGAGKRVGGEVLRYDELELPENEDGEVDEVAFERAKQRWPLGYLARVLGISREELLKLPRCASSLLHLDRTA